MRDKAVEEIEGTLFPLATHIVATAPKFARSLRPNALASMWTGTNLRTAPDLERALELVRRESQRNDVVFITGSLFLVGEARALLVQ